MSGFLLIWTGYFPTKVEGIDLAQNVLGKVRVERFNEDKMWKADTSVKGSRCLHLIGIIGYCGFNLVSQWAYVIDQCVGSWWGPSIGVLSGILFVVFQNCCGDAPRFKILAVAFEFVIVICVTFIAVMFSFSRNEQYIKFSVCIE